MAEKRKFQAIKGTRDLLPPETELWNRVEQTAREVFGTFGFGEIRLPIFEPTELFARSIGLDTEVISKEMFNFDLYGSRDLEFWRERIRSSEDPHQVYPHFFEFVKLLKTARRDERIDNTDQNRKVLERLD